MNRDVSRPFAYRENCTDVSGVWITPHTPTPTCKFSFCKMFVFFISQHKFLWKCSYWSIGCTLQIDSDCVGLTLNELPVLGICSDVVVNWKVPRLLFAEDIGDTTFACKCDTLPSEVPNQRKKGKVWRGFASRYWDLKQNLRLQSNLSSLNVRIWFEITKKFEVPRCA